VTPPPHSLLPEEFPALGDIFSRQVGITVGTCLLKWPRMDTGPSTGPPSQPYVPLVSPDLQGMSGVPVVMGIAHLHGVLQVPPSLPVAKVDVAILIGLRGSRDHVQEGPPFVFLAGVLLVCACHCLLVYTTSPIPVLTLKGGAGVTVVIPLHLRSSVGLQRVQ
jgi:hypothetical protein